MPNRIFILYATKQFSTVIICYENTDKNILESAILSLPELKYLPSKTRTGILENQEPITRLQQNITCMRDQGRMSVLVTGYPGLSGLIRMRNTCIQQWSQVSYQFTVSYYEKVCRIYQTWSLNIKICISLVFLEAFCNHSKAQSKRRTFRQTSNFS